MHYSVELKNAMQDGAASGATPRKVLSRHKSSLLRENVHRSLWRENVRGGPQDPTWTHTSDPVFYDLIEAEHLVGEERLGAIPSLWWDDGGVQVSCRSAASVAERSESGGGVGHASDSVPVHWGVPSMSTGRWEGSEQTSNEAVARARGKRTYHTHGMPHPHHPSFHRA